MYEYISDDDILVITKSGDERKDYEVMIENRLLYKTPVTVIVHDIDFVNKMLSEGQYFLTDIEQVGVLYIMPAMFLRQWSKDYGSDRIRFLYIFGSDNNN